MVDNRMKKKIGYLEKLRNENRIGKVSISHDLLTSMSKRRLNLFLKDFVIIRAESLFYNKTIEYVGFSPYFESIKEGHLPPGYKLSIFTDNKGKIINSEWVKLDNGII